MRNVNALLNTALVVAHGSAEKESQQMRSRVLLVTMFLSVAAVSLRATDFESRVKEGYVDSNGVRIHYATIGTGPLVVMIHGFPDYWYTWRKQMEGLSDKYQCVAIDQRGYDLSDKPQGVESYSMPHLVGDVIDVIKYFGKDKAIIVGHDWGGAVAWQLALHAPQFVDRLMGKNAEARYTFIQENAPHIQDIDV